MNAMVQTVLRGGLARHKRDPLLVLEYLVCMGPVTAVFVMLIVEFGSVKPSTVAVFVILAAPVVCLVFDLVHRRPPTSRTWRVVLGVLLLLGTAMLVTVTFGIPGLVSREGLPPWPLGAFLALLACMAHGVRRLVWLWRPQASSAG